ncbi:MAG TPA: ribonuclease H-like domain-containing protein [Kiritimatiellia bacterium]|nr:ribonuclease H-like domain-containing protein [Kiritimatiellia bacterium]HRU70335.1 ribonuclease H-like domain-containing protein [Kiritimatiellia bacterium]
MTDVLSCYIELLPNIGAERGRALRREGCLCWRDLLDAAHPSAGLDRAAWDAARAAAEAALRALEGDDITYFTARLPSREHWRVLARWFDRASFFDIETSGLDADSIVTLVCCYHRGQPLRFLADENLDDFLNLLDEIRLLVSFNGSSFDVPRVLDRFHIPALPCAHVDLRWLCHHAGWRGGLKAIERALGLRRPPDLEGLGGAEAVGLWQAWRDRQDEQARRTLERYCTADTVMLQMLAGELCRHHGADVVLPAEADLWSLVQTALPDLGRPASGGDRPALGHIVEPPPPKPAPAPVVAADLFSLSQMLGATGGLSRAEKQARLRERWRNFRTAE